MDSADTFPVVLQRADAWMAERQLGTEHTFAVLTDGYVVFAYDKNKKCSALRDYAFLCN